jgi:hypothetical protein
MSMKITKAPHDIKFDHILAVLEKAMVKPSGPGALSRFIAFTTSKTSLSSKGSSNLEASSVAKELKARPSNLGL